MVLDHWDMSTTASKYTSYHVNAAYTLANDFINGFSTLYIACYDKLIHCHKTIKLTCARLYIIHRSQMIYISSVT